jgi:hypothetical protein
MPWDVKMIDKGYQQTRKDICPIPLYPTDRCSLQIYHDKKNIEY